MGTWPNCIAHSSDDRDKGLGGLLEESRDATAQLHAPDNTLLTIWPVNRTVGNVRNNTPELLDIAIP